MKVVFWGLVAFGAVAAVRVGMRRPWRFMAVGACAFGVVALALSGGGLGADDVLFAGLAAVALGAFAVAGPVHRYVKGLR